jgi:hypothetical protein
MKVANRIKVAKEMTLRWAPRVFTGTLKVEGDRSGLSMMGLWKKAPKYTV